ncbi:hypothetical protein V5799_024647 [Amblyomma americanum]|uniref:U1 small nuclear ribonucleoprotein 70 kDa n=1 Tax=Amblyomma americanum TaxID=6943 RepID=A0AAQ4EBZ5_AMBAM
MDKLPHEKTQGTYTGVSHYLNLFEDPKDTPPPTRVETREERIERKRREKAEQVAYKLEQDIALWDPYNNTSGTMDPFKTLFVARINYDTSESKLRREFEVFGPIKKIVIVHNKITGKPRGYAFVEYEHERDMHSAYKHADGKKIDGRRVLVDVERGRTVKGWLPRRLGGGLGGTRRGGPDVNTKHSGREDSRMDDRYMGDRDGRDVRERDERMVRAPERERERRRSRSRDRERRHRSSKDDRRERRRDRPDRPDRERPERERSDRDRERPERRDRSDRGERPERGSDRLPEDGGGDVPVEREKRRRSRSRERKRRRSRSRSREHKRRRERNGAERGGVDIKQEPGELPQDGYASDGRAAPGGGYESAGGNAEDYGADSSGMGGYNSESQSSFKTERGAEEYN